MSLDIKQQFFYQHPAQDVWDFLTSADLMAQWLMPNDFKAIAGHRFVFRTKAMPQFASDGIMHCEIIDLIPLKKLSYTWKTGPGDGSVSLDTLVTWTLVEKNGGTELNLVHSGFHEQQNLEIFAGMTNGWKEKFEKIATGINSRKNVQSHS